MRAVGIAGPSDAGKTTLVERLVPALCGRVATVKSIHHDIEVDEQGKDTHRHRTAGAETVVGITPSLTFTVERRGKDDHATERAALERSLSRLDDEGFDYALVEGFTSAPLPTVVVGEGDEVAGDVIRRVPDGQSPDVESLADAVDAVAPWAPGEAHGQ